MKKQHIVTDTRLSEFDARVAEYLEQSWIVVHLSCAIAPIDERSLNRAFIAILECPND